MRCRADNWHPAKDRCAGGGKHTVVLTASDYFFTVEQRFVVNVRPRNSPLLLNDASFHWPTVEELVLVRKSAQAMRYHTRIPDALAMRRYGHAGRGMYGAAYGFTYELLHGRDPVESSLRSMLRALSRESRPSPSEVANLVSLVNDAGCTAEQSSIMAKKWAHAGLRAPPKSEWSVITSFSKRLRHHE